MELNEYLQITLEVLTEELETIKKRGYDSEINIADARKLRTRVYENLSIIHFVKGVESNHKESFKKLLDSISEFIRREIMKD